MPELELTLEQMAEQTGRIGLPERPWRDDLGLVDTETPLASKRTAQGRTYRLMGADDLARLPPIQWLVRGVIPMSGLGAIYGPPGCGKTFLALDLGAAVSAGLEWFGHRVTGAPVCYVALEGEAGISQRVRAYQLRHGSAALDFMHFVTGNFSLLRLQDIAALGDAIRDAGADGGLIIIDTLNRAAPGEDENSPDGMGRILAGCKALLHAVGGAILLVHHSGKDASRGPRGHSSFLAAIDTGIEVSNNDGRREWRASKVKDGPAETVYPFRLEAIELGHDDEGDPVTSCVVTAEDGAQAAAKTRRLPTGGNQRIIWNALGELLRNSTDFGMAGAPPTRPCVRLGAAIDALKDRLACDPDQRAYRTRLAITGLVSHELIGLKDDWLWCI